MAGFWSPSGGLPGGIIGVEVGFGSRDTPSGPPRSPDLGVWGSGTPIRGGGVPPGGIPIYTLARAW